MYASLGLSDLFVLHLTCTGEINTQVPVTPFGLADFRVFNSMMKQLQFGKMHVCLSPGVAACLVMQMINTH